MENGRKMKNEVSFEIKKHLGTISTYDSGWTKELNFVAWNGQIPKFDIRDWDKDHEHMSRGITLHEEEAKKLVDLLSPVFTTI